MRILLIGVDDEGTTCSSNQVPTVMRAIYMERGWPPAD